MLLIFSIVFSAIGVGYAIYGKRQRMGVPLAAGIALMVLPHFVSSLFLVIPVGVALIASPYFLRF